MKDWSELWRIVFTYLPLVLYAVLVLFTIPKQKQMIAEKRHTVLNGRMNANLTLVGFAFAVIGLLVSLFQKDLATVFDSIHLFSVGLACFFGSYVLLYLRLCRFFDTMSEALTNNGLWAVIAGLLFLFESFPELSSISHLFYTLLAFILLYVFIDILFKWKSRNLTN